MQILALGLLSLSVALLIVPSLYHQIACRGRTLHKALGVATLFAGWQPSSADPWPRCIGICGLCTLRR